MENLDSQTEKPLIHGVVLVAGGAIGAGMFALPLVSAGAWYFWSLFGMFVVWWLTYLAAKLLIEVNLSFKQGSSFATLVDRTLGQRWAWANNISIAFIMFILMYAYITAGSRILQSDSVALAGPILSLFFALVVAVLIYLGTSLVSRVSSVLLVGMVVSFLSAIIGLTPSINLTSLVLPQQVSYFSYLAYALPVFVTAFACAGLVPSLISHFSAAPEAKRKQQVLRSVLIGSAISLLVYIVWISVTLGNIQRNDFVQVANDGGGLAALIANLQGADAAQLNKGLTWFSHFAVVTSFLSIALGLVHFLNDRFKFGESAIGKLKAVCAAFLPPTLFSLLLPYGFVHAIGFAGLFVAFSFFIIPALMHKQQFASKPVSMLAVIAFGGLIVVLKLGSIAGLLPTIN